MYNPTGATEDTINQIHPKKMNVVELEQ